MRAPEGLWIRLSAACLPTAGSCGGLSTSLRSVYSSSSSSTILVGMSWPTTYCWEERSGVEVEVDTMDMEVLDRFPRFLIRIGDMAGTGDPDLARQLLGALDLEADLGRLRCSLLVLHGGADRIFLLENARRIYDLAGTRDRVILVWDDGMHCLYNHAHERNCLTADWFSEKLRG